MGRPAMNGAETRAGTWPAPAKINLFLHVLGRRADGYHDLQTVFQLLDWGDSVDIEATDSAAIERTREVPGVPEGDDLCLRAARLLQTETGTAHGARIALHKRVPAGAGLGGASSDAATVLHVLNRLWGCTLDVAVLAGIGAKLGADVPLFVYGHTAWGEGVGERLEPVRLGERHYVLLIPDVTVSTAGVFADPDLPRDTRPLDRGNWRPGQGRNDCERLVRARWPEIDRAFEALAAHGAPRLTGTGGALFVECPDAASAKATAAALECRYNVRAVRGVDRSPLLDALGAASAGA